MAEKKFRKEKLFKIEKKVFDDRTSYAIYKLQAKGTISVVESIIKEGKESVVLSAKDRNGKWIALKVYRTEHCDFKSMWKYLVGDPRFFGIKKQRRAVVCNWCKREFKNLKIAFGNGVSCPKPLGFYENVLAMSFIGEDGIPSPRLVDIDWEKVGEDIVNNLYNQAIEEIKKMVNARLVHADLSEYNILFHDGKLVLIDFSQAVTFKHPLFKEFLERDIRNINSFFKKIGAKIDEKLVEKVVE